VKRKVAGMEVEKWDTMESEMERMEAPKRVGVGNAEGVQEWSRVGDIVASSFRGLVC